MVEARCSCAAVAVEGSIYVFGGERGDGTPCCNGEVLNLATGARTALSMPEKLFGASAVAIDSCIVVIGYGISAAVQIYSFDLQLQQWECCMHTSMDHAGRLLMPHGLF